MVKMNVKFLILCVALSCLSSNAFSIESAPKAKAWAKSVSSSNKIPSVIFIENFPKENSPSFLKTSSFSNSNNFINIVSAKNADITLKLNAYRAPKNGDRTAHAKELNRLFGVSKIVLAPPSGGHWTLYSYANGRLSAVGSNVKPSKFSVTALSQWLANIVHYQGIVIDSKNGFILVATSKKFGKKGTQGVAVKRSSSYQSVPKNGAAGSAIIELSNSSAYYGVYKVVLGEKNIPIGTKIQLP
jgi:hypothetical protein